jgi:hypothetical protein
MEYFPVYKVCYLKKDGVFKTYQFAGKPNESKNSTESVKVVKQQIYLDDTILDIKLKVMEELKLDDIFVTANEMYMFNQAQVMLNADIVYELVKKKGCLKCFLDNLTQVSSNEPFQYDLPAEEGGEDEYDLDDIIHLNLNGPFLVDRVLGHKELADSASKLVCNPFKLAPPQTDDKETVNNSLGGGFKSDSLNKHRLFDCGDIANNVLFVCLAEDVMSSDDSIGELYFPLLSENKKKRERHYLNVGNQAKVKLLNDIKRYTPPNKLTFVSPWGIKLIHLTITQSVEQSIPLDLIFKNIHSQSMTPIIKYIPSDEKESLYRLYCDNKAEDGTLIPHLDLTQINTYVNELTSTQKNITFLFQQNGLDIICTLNKRGDINLKCDFQNSIKPLSDVQDMISNAVNFVITTTSNLITDGGFKIAHFSTLFDESVVIERLLYSCEVKRETNVNNVSIKRYLSCFKNILTEDENSHGPDETHLIYKRVSPHAHGIKTNITWMNSGKHVEVDIHDVINIRYLQTIPIYIESMLLIVFQKLSDEQYPTLSDLNRVCDDDESTSNSFGGQGEDEEEEEKNVDSHTQVNSDAENSNNTLLDSDSESSESNTEEMDANATQMDSDSETETEKELIPLPEDTLLDNQTEIDDGEEEEEEEEAETLEVSDDSELEDDKKKYVEHKIFKLDPLIISEKTSEVCSSNKPVVVTDGQLKVIQKNYPMNQKDVLRYGSPASNKKNNYLCPMYWCPKLNIPISAEEVQTETVNGIKQFSHPSCGKVIERTTQINNKSDGIIEMRENYQRRPALTNCSKGFCVPCCVQKNNPDEAEVLVTDVNSIIVDDHTTLRSTQLGFVPDHVRKLFGVHKYDRKTNDLSLLKPNKPYLLRVGVDGDKPQSFLGCVSRVLSLRGGIRELKTKIVEAIDIDRFIRCQNGNLVLDFQDSLEDINKHDVQFNNKIKMYKTSTIYQKLNMSDLAERLYFKQVVSALLNFTRFLNDDTAPIDYTYLWDILCVPNNKLFKNGINLIILVSNPIKNTVQLMCPTNHYSSEFYDPMKETLFLLRVDEDDDNEHSNGMYNPIGTYRINDEEASEESKVRILLSEAKDSIIKPILKNLIKPHISECRAHESLPEKTHLAPLFLSTLVKEIQKYDYQVTQQVLNYNNKVVGILAQSGEGGTGFVPCFPSGLLFDTKMDFVFISHSSVWRSYSETVDFLTEVSNKSSRRVPCRPEFRVIQMSKIVVGILTESKQFVQLSLSLNMEEATTGNLKDMFTDSEYVEVVSDKMSSTEKALFITDTKDLERENYVSRVKSEDNFYVTFKNTVRILLNNYENQKLKKEIHAILTQNDVIYQDKLIKVEKIIRQLVGKKVQFTGNDSYYKLIKTVSACIGNDKDGCSSSNLCGFTDGNCNLIVPRNNLISPQKKNEHIYFRRLTDELIRNNRIRAYLFRRQTAEGLGSLTYIINEDEVILTESTIHSYMSNLKPPATAANNPTNFNSFDEAIPSRSIPYSNTINVNNLKTTSTNKCESISKRIISGDKWNTYFPSDYHEITYGKSVNCSFDFAIYVIKNTAEVTLTKAEIRIQLIEEYARYTGEYEEKIRLILKLEGKPLAMNTNLSIWTIIQEAGYFLTALDLWLLLERHQVPFVFLSHSRIIETVKQSKILSGFTTKDKECVFIVLPSYSSSSPFSFKVIQNNEDTIAISLKDFKTFNTKTRADLTPIPMNEFVTEIFSMSAQNNWHNKNAIEQALEVFDMNVVLSIVDKTKTRKNKFFKRGTKKREV